MKIDFFPGTKQCEIYVKKPMPAKDYIPNWYKEIKPVTASNITFDEMNRPSLNIKMCMPFLDSMTTGYIQETWCDLHIEYVDEIIKYRYADQPPLIELRDKVAIPLSEDYYPFEFVWQEPWTFKLPKGYSAIVTHPFNFINLPFTTLTGIIDSDNYYHTRLGSHPFYIKKGFSGMIPAGTPMYQIIPFKRESWESIENKFDEENAERNHHTIGKKFFGSYKNLFWQKKEYR